MKKIIYLLLFLVLISSVFSMSSATVLTESKPLLSEMSESECIAFIKENGITLPQIYDSEAEWGPFVKSCIELFETDPHAPITISYTVNAKVAREIRNVVRNYYDIVTEHIGQNTLYIRNTSSTWLEHSTVYSTWVSSFENYNCYSYALGITDAWFDPGLITALSNNPAALDTWEMDIPNTTIEEIVERVEDDLQTLQKVRIFHRASEMDTSNLCTNESVICVRKGPEDYHFMRYSTDGWLHKPGETQILKYNITPTNSENWTNEAVYKNNYVEPDTVYDSTIYFISYDGHNWEYTPNGNGTHTKTCAICGDVFTLPCNNSYTYTYDDMHNTSCVDCGYTISGAFCTFTTTYNNDNTHTRACNWCSNSTTSNCTLTYTSTGSVRHTATCSICGNSSTQGCEWEYTTLSGGRHSYSCTKCDNSVSSELCTYAYTANDDNTHTATCTLCSNSYDNDCGFTYEYSGDNSHHGVCGRCGNVNDEACAPESTYCGDGDQTHAHTSICPRCDHVYGTESTACTFAYKSNGENTHVYACTQCRYVQSGPTACMFKSDNTCRFCGALKDSAVLNSMEEDFSES